ncbi:MAG: hypothetical protein HQM08_07985 [Candidatus Riflebacteria bacterium]|nr:hypothetical protein [Candidatus Riflebacteria bacterium]
MRILIASLVLALSTCMLYGQDGFDPAYVKTFGKGVVLASNKGYPEYKKLDPSKIKFKKGVCFIKPSEGKTLDIRYILPEGVDVSKIIQKLKAEQPENAKFQDGEDQSYWDLWISHDSKGTPNFDASKPWPIKLGDIPKWGPRASLWYPLTDDVTTGGAIWADLSSEFYDWLPTAKPGWKIWVSVSFGFNYKANAGEIENKWDPDKRKFIQVKSTGALGFVKSAPIMAGTIEIE